MFYHNTIRKYTLALLDFFKKLEVQYKNDNNAIITKTIPIHYKMKEKEMLLDKSQTQILSGNMNVIPRAVLELNSLSQTTDRQTSKFNKINKLRDHDYCQYQYNCVSYEFDYTLKILCRGLNEACQIVEEIAPKFNPNVAIDLYDAENESSPTRVPLQMTSIGIDTEGFDEKSMNICTVSCSLKLSGYLFQPIQNYSIIKDLKISLNTPYLERELMEWKVENKYAVQPPAIKSFYTKTNFYLDLVDLVLEDNKVKVVYRTNSDSAPTIEFASDTCRISDVNGDTCTVDHSGVFDISCSVEVDGYRSSIFKEFQP